MLAVQLYDRYSTPSIHILQGGRESKGAATSEGGKKQEPPEQKDNFYDCTEQDDNFYECLEEMEEDDEEEEMESDPGPTPGNCDICQSILRDQRNRRRLERNKNIKTARDERRQRR